MFTQEQSNHEGLEWLKNAGRMSGLPSEGKYNTMNHISTLYRPLTTAEAGNPAVSTLPAVGAHRANIQAINEAVQQSSAWVKPLEREMGRVIVGQQELVERLMVALLCNGHLLLEGVPGLAKTLALKTLASAIDAGFHRIQFTPDMLPADIIGTEVFHAAQGTFMVKSGPIFSNLILADEINRAPAKVQSALLEAMQERQVTIGEQTFPLPEPFLVMATQNPIEQEGTYPLPEAQLDRFMMKVVMGYPSAAEERIILDVAELADGPVPVNPMVNADQIVHARRVVNTVFLDDKVKDYIVSLVYATRDPERFQLQLKPYIQLGASPRATLSLKAAARALAYLHGRGYVTPQDIKSVAMDVLRHRVKMTYEAEAEALTSEHVVQKILDTVPVP
jgi:MoxR-like ATPase